MHGLGNDFVIVDARGSARAPDQQQIAAMTNRKTGIGCDQFIVLHDAEQAAVACFMRIYNAPDGTEAEACGNATRCVADYLMRDSGENAVDIQTVAGVLKCTRAPEDQITVDMGAPNLDWSDIPMSKAVETLYVSFTDMNLPDGVAVNVGNPHIVFFMEEKVEAFPVDQYGPKIETHALFPNKTNVEFCNVIDRQTIRMRVWERGVGVTQACGTGACAAAIAGMRRGLVDRQCKVILDGGTLSFHWREKDDHILMSGPATFVFKGAVEI